MFRLYFSTLCLIFSYISVFKSMNLKLERVLFDQLFFHRGRKEGHYLSDLYSAGSQGYFGVFCIIDI